MADDLVDLAGQVLSANGVLAERLPNFTPRKPQQQMAQAVAQALSEGRVLIVEAGTGTGKTYAYLVPALISGKNIIISTGTKTLQDQLFHRDLPNIRKILGVPVRIALLKGRSNYLCLHRWRMTAEESRMRRPDFFPDLMAISAWAEHTRTGDVVEVKNVPETSSLWPRVTSTPDNCIGTECADYAECFVVKARRQAQEADIVVVNHHLFFADLALRGEGYGEILPGAHAFIFDEAHQLPDLATQFFGLSLSSHQLIDLGRDCLVLQKNEAPDMPDLAIAASAIESAVRDMRVTFGEVAKRYPWRELQGRAPVKAAINALEEKLSALLQQLSVAAVRSKALENCYERIKDLQQRLTLFSDENDDNFVYWVETFLRSFTLHRTPLDVSEVFSQQVSSRQASWIFTSATLTTAGRFDYFAHRLGLTDAWQQRWDSPYDYADCALFYVPQAMPDPNIPGYSEAMLEAVLPVLKASRGRAFLLFTSHQALRLMSALLGSYLEYPLLVQGSAPKGELLADFLRLPDAVLLGTQTFWEGVDVRGPALSCVIIDRLPFAAPDDPITQARVTALQRRGANPFRDYQLPQAVMTLKQGVGRLIRDEHDRGVLMVCDPRIYTKAYGKTFLDSLPPMRRTRSIVDVQDFFS